MRESKSLAVAAAVKLDPLDQKPSGQKLRRK